MQKSHSREKLRITKPKQDTFNESNSFINASNYASAQNPQGENVPVRKVRINIYENLQEKNKDEINESMRVRQ